MSFFDALNSIDTKLGSISKEYWEQYHKWPADEILKVIDDDYIVDLGSGCGLFGLYALYTKQVDFVELWEGDFEKMSYARQLAYKLGIQDNVKSLMQYAEPSDIVNKTVVSIRMGSMQNFERFFIHNKLITLRRTEEVEPYFIRRTHLPWDIKVVTRDDGFKLELLQHDFKKFTNVLEGERWMEDLNPLLASFGKDKEQRNIGQDI